MVEAGNVAGILAVLQVLKDLGFESLTKPIGMYLEGVAEANSIKRIGAAENARTLESARTQSRAADIALEGDIRRDMQKTVSAAQTEVVRDFLSFELGAAAREYRNRRRITEGMARLLQESDSPVRPGDVEPDWYSVFYDQCKHVSDEDMQDIWSSVLAGEIQEPGSFARQTLDVARTMSRSDWVALDSLIPYLWWIGGVATIPAPGIPRATVILKHLGIPYATYMALRDVGIFTIVDNPYHRIRIGDELVYSGNRWRIEELPSPEARMLQERMMKAEGELALVNIPLSRAGSQVARLRPPRYDPSAYEVVKRAFEAGGLTLFPCQKSQ